MNYWANNDPLFADGHYVEEWELSRFKALSQELQAFLQAEASAVNKLQSITGRTVFLSAPPCRGIYALPDVFCFFCPIHHTGTRVLDGDEDGVIVNLTTGERIYPSGFESPHEFATRTLLR